MNSFGTNTLQPLNVCKVWTAILDMVNGLMRVQDIQYIWNSEDLAVVSVSPRSCKACALYEDRKFPLKKVDGPVADVSLPCYSSKGCSFPHLALLCILQAWTTIYAASCQK